MNVAPDKERIYRLIDCLDNGQLAAIVHLLEVMADPVERSLALAPTDDEPVPEGMAAALDDAYASIERGEGISHEEMRREFGM